MTDPTPEVPEAAVEAAMLAYFGEFDPADPSYGAMRSALRAALPLCVPEGMVLVVRRDLEAVLSGHIPHEIYAVRNLHDQLAAQKPAACDMGELCIGCEPRNADGSCPDQQTIYTRDYRQGIEDGYAMAERKFMREGVAAASNPQDGGE